MRKALSAINKKKDNNHNVALLLIVLKTALCLLSFYFQNYSLGCSELFLLLFNVVPLLFSVVVHLLHNTLLLGNNVVFIDYYISLYVSFKELDVSVNLQRLGGGGHQHAFACLKGEGVALVISNGGVALNANEDNKAVKL